MTQIRQNKCEKEKDDYQNAKIMYFRFICWLAMWYAIGGILAICQFHDISPVTGEEGGSGLDVRMMKFL